MPIFDDPADAAEPALHAPAKCAQTCPPAEPRAGELGWAVKRILPHEAPTWENEVITGLHAFEDGVLIGRLHIFFKDICNSVHVMHKDWSSPATLAACEPHLHTRRPWAAYRNNLWIDPGDGVVFMRLPDVATRLELPPDTLHSINPRGGSSRGLIHVDQAAGEVLVLPPGERELVHVASWPDDFVLAATGGNGIWLAKSHDMFWMPPSGGPIQLVGTDDSVDFRFYPTPFAAAVSTECDERIYYGTPSGRRTMTLSGGLDAANVPWASTSAADAEYRYYVDADDIIWKQRHCGSDPVRVVDPEVGPISDIAVWQDQIWILSTGIYLLTPE